METATNTDPSKPDALLYGPDFKGSGPTVSTRIHAALDRLEPMLGGQVYIRDVGGGNYLATRSHSDTLAFPSGHPRAGEPRYVWESQPNGLRFGRLVEGAQS